VSAPLTFNGQKHPAPANLLRSLVATQDERERVPAQIRFVERWVHEPPASDIAGAVAEVTALGEMFNQPALPGADFAIARFPLSKSSIESYARCPRQFFYRKVLRLDDDESAPLVVGNIFHGVMDAVGQAYPGTSHLPAALDAAFIEEQVDDALQAHKIAASSFYHSTLRRHLIDMVRGAIKLDIAKSDGYTVEETEAMFKFEHGGFEFSGRADRIDRVAGDLSLVDFKTGKEHKRGETLRRKTLDIVDSPGEGNWQVPIYVWAYRDHKGGLPASFRMLVQRPGETPFFVTLYIRDRMENVPESATSNKRDHQGFSYLLAEELENIMARAVALSDEVFAERDGFVRTDNIKHCRNCTFSRLCGRDAA